MKKLLIFILILLLLIAALIPLNLFIIGEPVDGAQLYYDVQMSDNVLIIQIGTPESAVALRGVNVRQEGSVRYISLRKVLVSSLFPSGTATVEIDPLKVDSIYLGGKQIWSSQ